MFTAVDLFAGAGGLSLGFQRAGFDLLLALDSFDAAADTYKKNFSDTCLLQDITEECELPYADVFIGGPPCQGFSSAGRRQQGDSRNSLVGVFSRLVASYRPQAFVFENVEGFLTAESGSRVLDLLDPLIESGYFINFRKVNAANYGVPQHRKRVLVIGGLGWAPTFPDFSHLASGAPGASLVFGPLPSTPSLSGAIHSLPPASNEPPGVPQWHFNHTRSEKDMERIWHLVEGQTMRQLPESLWHGTYKRRAHRRVMDGIPSHKRGGAPSGIRRLSRNHPAKAITSRAPTEFAHYSEDRFLTLRECARIQTFPDDFLFSGRFSDVATLIGNAVPPLLAEVIGRQLFADLHSHTAVARPGRLVSFVPTLSNGHSPALRQVIEMVEDRYKLRPSQNIEQQVLL